jgi:hypothetical protein
MDDILKIFEETAKNAFDFLVTDCEMQRTVSKKTLFTRIRYRRGSLFLDVWFDTYSYEIDVATGLISKSGKERCSYGMAEVLEASLGHNHKITTFYQSSTPEGVRECVQSLASVVEKHYQPVLNGDEKVFRNIDFVQAEMSEGVMREMRLANIRKEASRAWQKKDFRKVAELYGTIQLNLTPSEAKKLGYARKQVKHA